MAGRTVLVTGGTAGIGKATALGLARMGAHVAIIGRDGDRAEETAREIRAAGGEQVDTFVGDLTVQSEVRRLADEVLQRLPRIDVLVNNVGGYWNTRHLTADGRERTFALNHLAPFLLTNLLLDRLTCSAPARVVTVSSNAQAMGRIDFDDLEGERSYSGAQAYNQSKLANVLFTYELARRLNGTSVTANALHPGVVSTAFGAEDPGRTQRLFVPFLRPFMKTPARGAATSIHVAAAPDLEHVTGQFFANRKPKRSAKTSYDETTAARLWQVSADLVGLAAAPHEPEVKPIPDNYPRVVPYLCVDGASAAIAFYRDVFGATERMRMVEPDGRIGHAELEIGTAVIMLADEFPDLGVRSPRTIGGTPVTMTLYVEDVDAVFTRATDAGATVLSPVKNQFYGDRTGQFEDPFGHRWGVATHVEDVSPEDIAQRAVAMTG